MWPESSSVNTINLVIKYVTDTEIMSFPKVLFFIGAACRNA